MNIYIGKLCVSFDEKTLSADQEEIMQKFQAMLQDHEQMLLKLLGQILSTTKTKITIQNRD